MNETIREEIEDIVKIIKEKKSIEKIILFGSYAKGNETNESDIDLCIISKNKKRIEVLWDIRDAIFEVAKHSVDLLLFNNIEFNDRAISKTSLENQILKTGIVLYG